MGETIEINGREYTEDEIRAIYEYQKREYQKEDIRYGIECVQTAEEYEGERYAEWLSDPINEEAVFNKACSLLDRWQDLQNEVLSNNDATINLLTEELARGMCR